MSGNLFLGLEAVLPSLPELGGRAIKREFLHLTLLFFGKVKEGELIEKLKISPIPSFKICPAAKSSRILHLSHVLALDIEFMNKSDLLFQWKNSLEFFFSYKESRPYLPHVTITRQSDRSLADQSLLFPIPCYFKNLHLYQGLGNSEYSVLWTHPFSPIFEPLDHTADYGFVIFGESYNDLYLHALMALSDDYHALRPHLHQVECAQIEDVIIHLNKVLSFVDQEVGIGIKAVSFHAKISESNGILKWEMIVDI